MCVCTCMRVCSCVRANMCQELFMTVAGSSLIRLDDDDADADVDDDDIFD